jgi:hypothetical protein
VPAPEPDRRYSLAGFSEKTILSDGVHLELPWQG